MKRNTAIYKLVSRVVLLICLMIFFGCSATKSNLKTDYEKEKDTIARNVVTTQLTTINQSIDDTMFIPLATGDMYLDSLITNRFKNFRTYKKSGANSYLLKYDTKHQGLQIRSKVGQTENSLHKKIDSLSKVKSKVAIHKQEIEVVKYRIPSWFVWLYLISLAGVYTLTKLKIL